MFRWTCTPACYNSDSLNFLSHKPIYSEAFCSTVFKITHILTHIIFCSKLAVPSRKHCTDSCSFQGVLLNSSPLFLKSWGPHNNGLGSYFAWQIQIFCALKPELYNTLVSQEKAQKSMFKKWLSSDQVAELKMGHSPVTMTFLCRAPQT